MGTRLADCRLFLREFVRNFHTTGAILPSGRFLSAALARFVAERSPTPRRMLEVGPGTGAVTRHLVAALGTQDQLDLVELNESFVDRLRALLRNDPAFKPVADRVRVLHCRIEDLPADQTYHVVVSGLPLNNFAVAEVQQILAVLAGLLEPGGTISFFEYIAIRSLKAQLSFGAERARLRGISQVLGSLLKEHQVRCDWIWGNVPPAWVHHLRF